MKKQIVKPTLKTDKVLSLSTMKLQSIVGGAVSRGTSNCETVGTICQ
ncbi:MAG: class I lanthipeptide [Spirosomataceae bacterium]